MRLGLLFYCVTGLTLAFLSLPARAGQLSPLAPTPNWSSLDGYQRTISRQEFTRLINQVYSIDGAFWDYADINDKRLILYSDTGKKQPIFTLNFAGSESSVAPRPYSYKTQSVSNDPSKPLKGLRIALDPGHIGGDWAQLEARYFKLGDDPPVLEAKLNFITCERLAELLEADGADIIWAKRGYNPVTDLRPADLRREAIAALAKPVDEKEREKDKASGYTPSFLFGIQQRRTNHATSESATERRINNEAALLFYRVAEIRARGDVVNRQHPDLTICVHYNADDWGDDPDHHPVLVARSRLIIFTNGHYDRGTELVYDDYKYDLMRKLLDRTATQEERGCALVGQSMLDTFKYPPDVAGKFSTHRVTDVPSVYARNLIANRIYHGPVIYCEGPYMNARDAYYRIIAGDYLGMRTIQGQSVPSIYRDYATAVEKGVLKYFAK
jgi:hypothetical protein